MLILKTTSKNHDYIVLKPSIESTSKTVFRKIDFSEYALNYIIITGKIT